MKHAFLRRSAAFVLSLALMIGMIPSGIVAVPTADAADVLSSVTFDFRKHAYTDDTFRTQATPDQVTEYSGSRMWKFASATLTSGSQWHGSYSYFLGSYGGWAAFKIKGLDAGLYNVALKNLVGSKACVIDAYLLPASVVEGKTDTSSINAAIAASLTDTYKLGENDWSVQSGSDAYEEKNIGSVELAGDKNTEYVLVVRTAKAGASASAPRLYLQTVTFNQISYDQNYDFRNNVYQGDPMYNSRDPRAITAYGGSREWVYLEDTANSWVDYHSMYTFFIGTPSSQSEYGGWAAFKIKNLSPGTYDVTLGALKGNGCNLEMYILPADVISGKTAEADVEAAISAALTAAYKVESVDWSLDSGYGTNGYGSVTVGGKRSDERILVFKMASAGTGATKPRMYLQYLEFKYKETLGSIQASFDNVTVGAKLEPIVSYLNNGGGICSGAGVVEKIEIVDNASGALLAGKDGNIYAIKEGTATVKVTAKLTTGEGGSKTANAQVTVLPAEKMSGAKLDVLFYKGAYPDMAENLYFTPNGKTDKILTEAEFKAGFLYQDYGTVRPWGLVSGLMGSPNSGGSYLGTISGNVSDTSINNDGGFLAFKVKVPAAGKYNVTFTSYFYQNAGIGEFYMLPYDASAMTFSGIQTNLESYTADDNKIGSVNMYIPKGSSDIGRKTVDLDPFVAEEHADYAEKGYREYLLIVKRVSGVVPFESIIFNGTGMTDAETTLAYDKIGVGETTSIVSTVGKYPDGSVVDTAGAYIQYSVPEEYKSIITIDDNNVITAVGEGNAKIETIIIANGTIAKGETSIEVNRKYAVAGVAVSGSSRAYIGTSFRLVPHVTMGDGTETVPAGAEISYKVISGDASLVNIDGGKLTAGSIAGNVTVAPTVSYRGKVIEGESIELTITDVREPLSGAIATYKWYVDAYTGESSQNITDYMEYTEERAWAYIGSNASGTANQGSVSLTSVLQAVTAKPGEYVAMKIKVPAAGRYQVMLNAYCRYRTAIMDLYAIPYSEEVAANPTGYLFDAYKLASVDTYSAVDVYRDFFLEDAIFDTAGEYILVLHAAGKNAAASDYCMYPKTLTIDGVSVVDKVELKVDAPKLGVGETTSFEMKAYLSNGMEIPVEDAEVEYTTDIADVLTIDEANKLIRTKAEGAVTVTATVSYKGCSATGSALVTADDYYGVNKEIGVYLYGETAVMLGDAITFIPAVVLNNQTILDVSDGTIRYEIVEGEGVVSLANNATSLVADAAGVAKIKAYVTYRGDGEENTYESETVEITVAEPQSSSANLDIVLVQGGHAGDTFNDLREAVSYTANRAWKFEGFVGASTQYPYPNGNATYSQQVYNMNAATKYLALRVKVPGEGKYNVKSDALVRNRAGKYEMYMIPADKADASGIANLIDKDAHPEYYVGAADYYDPSGSVIPGSRTYAENYEFTAGGEYIMVLKCVNGAAYAASSAYGDAFYLTNIIFENTNSLGRAEITAEKTTIQLSESVPTAIELFKATGEAIDFDLSALDSLTYRSTDTSVITVDENGVVTGVGEGTAEVKAIVVLAGIVKQASLEITVSDSSNLEAVKVPETINIYVYGGQMLNASAHMASGNVFNIPSEYVTWEILPTSDEGVITVENGMVMGTAVGTAYLKANISPDYKPGVEAIDVPTVKVNVTWDATVNPAIYTLEERENAKINASRYAWAANQVESAKKAADPYVKEVDKLYDLVVPEGLPRYYHVGHKYDPKKFFCRYCNGNIGLEYGSYAWLTDPLQEPWKIQCPICRRKFPSNDFGSFYELGKTDSGGWNYEQAIAKHTEMFGTEPNVGYLKNIAYPEMDTLLGVQGWGVDDSRGYKQPYISDPELPGYDIRYKDDGKGMAMYVDGSSSGPVQHTYIAYYIHEGVWYGAGGSGVADYVVRDALKKLADAFVYTGDAKYGRVGAILLDRVADVYPGFDWYQWASFRGDNYRGKIADPVWENTFGQQLPQYFDAFLPIYNDPYVVDYLSKKAPRYETDEIGNWKRDENGELIPVNLKDSPGALRKHVEDNILREIFNAIRKGQIWGNFGMHQASVTAAAMAFNRMPETKEWLDWMMAPGTGYNTGPTKPTPIPGGNVLNQLLVEVDRDGNGNENAPGYNNGWTGNLLNLAEMLAGYELYPEADLFNNPKFIKMVTGQLGVTLGGYYAAQTGDSGAVASTGMVMSIPAGRIAFQKTGNIELARALYFRNKELNGDDTTLLRGTIFDADPEKTVRDIEKIVEEYGEFSIVSGMMTGYGFAALRDGGRYKAPQTSQVINTHRDFAVYFGSGASHGHSDALNLYISAFGLNFAPDLGYPEQTGEQPNRMQWVDTTLSHNTVVVDEKAQTVNAQAGTPYHFDDAGRVKILDVDADVYSNTDAYRRTVFMIQADDDVSYGVDFFHVKGGDDHLYSFHSQSDQVEAISGLGGLTSYPTYEGENGKLIGTYAGPNVPYGSDPTGNAPNNTYPLGYTWLKNVRTYNEIEKNFSLEFTVKDWRNVMPQKRDLRLRMTMVSDEPLKEVSFTTAVPPQTANNKGIGELEYVLVRNTGKNLNTTFTTVFEPYEDGSRYIESIEKVPMIRDGADKPGLNDSFSAVKVTHTNGRADYVMYSTNNAITYTVDDKITFRGFAGVITIEDVNGESKVVYSYLNDGEILDVVGAAEEEKALPAYTGTVTDFTKDFVFDNYITFAPDQQVDAEELAGKYIYVDNTAPQNGSYMIESAKVLENGDIELFLGNTTIIDGFVDAEDVNLGYTYNIAEGQSLRIPLNRVMDGAPIFAPQDKKSIASGRKLTVNISAESPLEKEIMYEEVALPRGAFFDAESGTLTWTPDENQIGVHTVAIKATDGKLSSIQYITIEVFKSSGTAGENTAAPSAPSNPPAGNTGNTGTNTGSQSGTGSGTTSPSTGESGNSGSSNNGFGDLCGYGWAKNAINQLAEEGVVNGTGGNTFSPGRNITRADFAIMMVRAFCLKSESTDNFDDVDPNAYYAKELAIAKAHGIVNGVGNNRYDPTATITRQDMMTVVSRALIMLGYELKNADDDTLAGFIDAANIADYAYEHVARLVANELVNGKTENTIDPKAYTTRAEVAVLIKRLMDAFLEE